MKLPGIQDYVDHGYNEVPGWFRVEDLELFDLILDHQNEVGITGNILEVGCYQGRSAIALGYGLNGREHLHVIDLFEDHAGGLSEEGMAVYEGLQQQIFEANYGAFHHRAPVISAVSSTNIDLGGEFRFIHVDGGHDYATVAADIDLAVKHSKTGTVIAIDDYRTHHTPGVSAAAWTAMGDRDLYPFLLSEVKMYATTTSADWDLWFHAAKNWIYQYEEHIIDGLRVLRKL